MGTAAMGGGGARLAFFGVFFHLYNNLLLVDFKALALPFKFAARSEKMIGMLRAQLQHYIDYFSMHRLKSLN